MGAKVLMAIVGLLGLYSLFTVREYFARVILAVMVLAIGLTFLGDRAIESGFWLYCVSLVLVMVYALLKRGLGTNKRILILLMAVPVFLTKLFMINHWPYVSTLALCCIITLVCFIACIAKVRNYKNEVGFLTIIAADAIVNLLTAV